METSFIERGLRGLAILAILLLLATLAKSVWAEEAPAVPVGDAMPAFTLPDTAGQSHTLAQYKGKIVVLDFCSQKCPWSRGVDPSFNELIAANAGQDIVFLGVDSHFDTPVEEIKKYVEENAVSYIILKDEGNVYADQVAATRTPEFYVVDRDGRLAYHGAFDDRKTPDGKGETHFLADALADLTAGRAVQRPEVNAWGCTIKRAPKPSQSLEEEKK